MRPNKPVGWCTPGVAFGVQTLGGGGTSELIPARLGDRIDRSLLGAVAPESCFHRDLFNETRGQERGDCGLNVRVLPMARDIRSTRDRLLNLSQQLADVALMAVAEDLQHPALCPISFDFSQSHLVEPSSRPATAGRRAST
jgi:hypothetical protein